MSQLRADSVLTVRSVCFSAAGGVGGARGGRGVPMQQLRSSDVRWDMLHVRLHGVLQMLRLF